MIINDFDLRNYIVIPDANAFMHKYFQRFLKNEIVAAINNVRCTEDGKNFFMYIPTAVMEELENISKRKGTEYLQQRTDAIDGQNLANRLVEAGYARFMKSDYTGTNKRFNDVAMLTIFMELRRHRDIALITNDRKFATDAIGLNWLHSVNSSYEIKALFVDLKKNVLAEWLLDPPSDDRIATRFPNENLK